MNKNTFPSQNCFVTKRCSTWHTYTNKLFDGLLFGVLFFVFTQALFTSKVQAQVFGSATDYNLFVRNSAGLNYSDVEGRVAVGGNLVVQDGYSIGMAMTPNSARYDLVVGGTFTSYWNMVMEKGSIRHVGAYTQGQNAITFATSGSTRSQGTSPIDFTATQTILTSRSASLSALASTGTVTNSGGILTFTGTNSSRNIFSLTSLPTGITSIRYNVPVGSTIIINVGGATPTMSGAAFSYYDGSTYTSIPDAFASRAIRQYSKNIIWNFHAATSLTLNAIGWKGTVLAPNADSYLNNGHIDGQLFVKSMYQSAGVNSDFQVNWIAFAGVLPVGVCGTISTATSNSPACVGNTINLTSASSATAVSYIEQYVNYGNFIQYWGGGWWTDYTSGRDVTLNSSAVIGGSSCTGFNSLDPVLWVNGVNNASANVWQVDINVVAGTTYNLSFQTKDLWGGASAAKPRWYVAGTAYGTASTLSTGGCAAAWTTNSTTYTATSTGTIRFSIRNTETSTTGNTNDFGIDNVSIYKSVTSANTFGWTGPNSFTSASQNPSIANATVSNAGVYTVSLTNHACVGTSTTSVVVNSPPTATASSNSPVLVGGTINLTSTGGGTYAWTGPSSFVSTLQNPSRTSATTAMSGIYTVTVTSGGCTATATTSVSVSTCIPPNITAISNSPVCTNATIHFETNSTTPGASYSWTGPNGFTSTNEQFPCVNTAATINAGVYTAMVTANGCTATATVNIVVSSTVAPPPPTVATVYKCAAGTATFTATGCAGTVNWYDADWLYLGTGTTYTTLSLSQNTEYLVECQTATCLSEKGNAYVIFQTAPTPSISASSSSVCAGQSVILTANSNCLSVSPNLLVNGGFENAIAQPWWFSNNSSIANNNAYTGTYANKVTGSAAGIVLNFYNLKPNTNYTYSGWMKATTTGQIAYTYARGYGGAELRSTNTISTTYQQKTITFTTGSANTSVEIGIWRDNSSGLGDVYTDDLSLRETNPTCTYSWSPGGATTPSITVSPTSTATYTLTNGLNGCTNTASTTITIIGTSITVSSQTICNGQSATLTATGCTGTVSWSNGVTAASITVNPTTTTTYTATCTPSVTNLLGNSSFETNALTPWANWGSTTITAVSTERQSGTYGAKTTATSTAGGLGQDVAAVAGEVFTVTAYGKVNTATPWSALGIKFLNSSFVQVGSVTEAEINATAFQQYTLNATAPAGTAWIQVYGWSNTGAIMYLDNFNLTKLICTTSTTGTVTVNNIPAVPTTTGASRCGTGSVTLSASGCAGTYVWYAASSGGTPLVATATYTTPSIAATTTYYVNCTVNGCTGLKSSATATINPSPVATASGSATCLNGTISLTSAGGTSYSWTGPSSFASTLQNPTRTNATAGMAGVYTVTVTNANGCMATATTNVAFPAISIANIVVSSCINQPLQDVATVSMSIVWTNAPSGDKIKVVINNKTEYIDVVGGATSPQTVTFIVPANGIANNTISASWVTLGAGTCNTLASFNAPVACSSDNLNCEKILYLCGPDKPADGDAYDHGFMFYLTSLGANLTPTYTKPDASGYGLYDPLNIATAMSINLNNYTTIIVSPTTQANLAPNLLAALKTYTGGILMMNFAEADDLGLTVGNAFYNFQNNAYTNNTNQITIYNYDNINPTYDNVLTGANYVSNADGSLWFGANNMSSGTNGVNFNYTASDVLPGVTSHGARVYLGFHANGIYSNAQNGGARPAPASSYFSPTNHLTLEAKVLLDQAIKNATTGVIVTATGDTECAGGTISLTSTGVGINTYAWAGPNSFVSTLQNPTIANATAAMGGIYTITVTSTTGCTATATANVVVSTIAAPTSAGASRCSAGSLSLTANGCAGTYNWYSALTGGASLSAAASYTTPSLSSTTNYYVSCTVGSCTNITRTTVAATINSTPTSVSAGSNSPVTYGNAINLSATATGATTYAWTGPNSFTSNVQNPTIAISDGTNVGTYMLTAAGAGGCAATATTEVFVFSSEPGVVDCSVIPVLNFTSPSIISGIAGAVGTQYRFSNILAGTDAIVTIQSKSHADIDILNIDSPAAAYGGYDAAMQPIIDYNWINGGGLFDAAGDKSVTFKIDFVNAGTITAKVVPLVTMTGLDIDGSGVVNEVREFVNASGHQSFEKQTTSTLTISENTKALGPVTTYSGVNETILDVMASYFYPNVSSITVTYGANWGGATADFVDNGLPNTDEARLNSLYFKCFNLNEITCNPVTAPTTTGASRCGTGTLTLSASACTNGTYNWYDALTGGASLGANATFTTPSIATTKSYYVDCTLAGCTSSPRTAAVATINAIPTPIVAGDVECLGSTISLTASGGNTYAWTGPSAFASTLQNPTRTSATLAMGGIYSVTLTGTSACTATATVNVTVSALPTPAITGTTTICNGQPTTLTATGGNYYVWSNGSTSAAITINPTSNTSYTATVYQNSVTSTNLITNVANFNAANFSLINATNSYGGPSSLFDNIDNTVGDTFHATRVTNGADWGISYNLGGDYLITNLSLDRRNDCCTDRGEGGVMQVWRNGTMVYQSAVLNSTGDAVLAATPAPNIVGTEVRYVFLAGANTLSGENTLNFTEWIIGGTKLCSATATANVVVNAIPAAPTSAGASRCGTGTVALSASGCAGGTVSWYGALTGGTAITTGVIFTTPSMNAPSTANYYLECSLNSCVSSTRNIVTATVSTVPTASATANFPVLGGTLNLGSTGGGSYSWTGPNSFVSTQQNVSTSPVIALMSGTYTVTVNVNGCTATATTSVFIAGENTPGSIDCSLIPTLNFANPSLILGTAFADNAQYRFSNVTAGTDAIVTIVSRTHADITISSLDIPAATYGGYDAAMQPIIDYNWINGGGSFDAAGEKSVTFKIDFVNTGTTTPKIIPNLIASGIDIDGSGLEVREFMQTTGNQSHQLENPTSLTMSGTTKVVGSYTTFAGINELALDAIASFGYTGKSSITVTIGAEWNGNAADFGDNVNPTMSDENRLNSLYFKCINLDNTYCDLVLAPPATTPTSRCGSGEVTLSASGCTGIYTWFSVSTGGTSIGTGSSLVIASISTTTTYYVECNAVGCTSVRASVVATINTIPAAPTVTGGSNCGTGTVILSATGCTGGTIAWFNSATGGTSLTTGTNFSIAALANSTVYFAGCTNSNACVSITRSYGVATINPIPQAQLSTINPTCLGMQSVSNGKLVLTKFEGIDQFSYNIGATYNAGTATGFVVIPANGEVLTGIADPGTSITYTVRIRNIENCTVDKTVTINKQCGICPVSFCEPPSNITKTK